MKANITFLYLMHIIIAFETVIKVLSNVQK